MYSELSPTKQKHQLPCPVCGSQDYDWGFMYATGYQSGEQYNMWRMKRSAQVMKVRRCKVCDNVQQFFDDDASKQVMRTTWIVLGVVFLFMFLIIVVPLALIPM